MLLDYVHLENFGPFQGPHRLDLSPSEDGQKSIVLIGADNGGGKTTLLSGLKVCFYGRRASELWDGGLQGYKQFIRERFNNAAFDKGERQMVLETGLRVWDQRIPIRLVVRRSFTLTDNRQFLTDNEENLEVYRDGKLVDRPLGDRLEDDEANQFDEFLRVLIPAHLAQFYFFDGERVRELFREATAENISQAIRDLLGLSLFERLADDLKDYRRVFVPRLYGKHQDKQAQLAETKAQRDQCNAQIQKLASVYEIARSSRVVA